MGKQYDDVVVILAPAAVTAREVLAIDKGETTSSTCWYDAFIYTNLPAEDLTPVDRSSAQLESIGRLPLVGQEHVLVHWGSYQNYIFRFFLGEIAARAFLRGSRKKTTVGETHELFEIKGSFLRKIFEGGETRSSAIRVWWHSELPELVALPWELMAYAHSSEGVAVAAAAAVGSTIPPVSEPKPLFSFTRGLPVETATPKIPVSGPLRLAFIHEPRTTSKALLAALETAPQGVEITAMTGPPREALQQAAAEGYELVHLVTDGAVSLANDGTLYLRKSLKVREGAYKNRILRTLLPFAYALSPLGSLTKWLANFLEAELEIDKCSPSELSGILRGSRISLLSLSTPKSTNTESDRLDGYLLPKVYRAFCSLGTSRLPLPTIVAPVGATDDAEITNFWRCFYADLGQHLDLRLAMDSGFASQPPMAMALFLRHSEGEVFTRISAEEKQRIVDPTEINLALQLSQELVKQLNAQFGEGQDLPVNFERLLSKETQRQMELKAQLERWIEPGGEVQL